MKTGDEIIAAEIVKIENGFIVSVQVSKYDKNQVGKPVTMKRYTAKAIEGVCDILKELYDER